MFSVPVTFVVDWDNGGESVRRKAMEELAAAGGKHVVLGNCWIENIMQDHKFAGKLLKEVEENSLSLVDSHSPFGGVIDLNCPDKSFREQMLLRHELAIEIAASLGVKTITIHPGSDRFFPEIPLEQHLNLMRNALDRLLKRAEKSDVIICIENSMSRAACPAEVVKLKNEYPTDYLGLCYDSGHANQLDNGRYAPGGEIWKFWQTVGVPEPEWDDSIIEKMLPEMVNCHLHDNDGSCDSHSIPGEGNTDWKKVVAMLKKAPRLQAVQCEVKIAPRYTVEQVFRKFQELGSLA